MIRKSKWEISEQDITKKEKIGTGNFGQVFRGYYLGGEVAIKEIQIEKAFYENIMREMKTIFSVKHPCIITLYGICISEDKISVVTEYMSKGNLRAVIDKYTISDKLKVRMLLDTANALLYLHSLGFVHRDIKSQNLLVNSDWRIKLADFGLSREVASDYNMTGAVGTLEWMAPEIFSNSQYDNTVDVFSFGLVMCELIKSCLPLRKTISRPHSVEINKSEYNIPGIYSLIKSCLKKNNRPRFNKICVELQEIFFNTDGKINITLKKKGSAISIKRVMSGGLS